MNDSDEIEEGVEMKSLGTDGTPSTSSNTKEQTSGDSSDEIDAEISRLE